MKEQLELHGVILKSQPIGEYDRRVVILTKERGRITAFARGARRLKSPLIAATNPFVFAVFTLYEGRSAYTLAAAEVVEYFQDLSSKFPGVWYGFYVLELAEYFSREGLEAAETVNLVYVTLRAIMREKVDPGLIRRIYELRMLTDNGVYAPPSPEEGIEESVRYALRFCALSPVSDLYSFSLAGEAYEEFDRIVELEMKRNTDRPFKSLAVISDMVYIEKKK